MFPRNLENNIFLYEKETKVETSIFFSILRFVSKKFRDFLRFSDFEIFFKICEIFQIFMNLLKIVKICSDFQICFKNVWNCTKNVLRSVKGENVLLCEKEIMPNNVKNENIPLCGKNIMSISV